jgi:hypothetical protein
VAGFGKLTQDLAHSDHTGVKTALYALSLDLYGEKEKCDTFTVWEGSATLVHLLKDSLKKVMKEFPACDQVIEANELPELATVVKTLVVISYLTYYGVWAGSVLRLLADCITSCTTARNAPSY